MYASTTSATKENLLKSIRFETPDYIPMTFHINASCFDTYNPEDLFDLMEKHPFLFPNFQVPKEINKTYDINAYKDKPYTDDFGCVWKTTTDGIVGSVHEHPLADWDSYKDYHMPNPDKSNGLGPFDWNKFEKKCKLDRDAGIMTYGDLRHGHTFLQLCDLRGYENLIYDMMDEEPLLDDLIIKLSDFNVAQINHFIAADVDMIRIPEDLGMQHGPMLSVDNFVRYIKLSYKKMIDPAKKAGKIVHMHSDGDIKVLVENIMDDGVDIINLQDLVNGIDWIAERFRGRTCVDLDIDRQSITPFGTPQQIDDLIKEEVKKIGCKEGGLMMIYGLYPGVPLENIKALMDAMEHYAFYYRD